MKKLARELTLTGEVQADESTLLRWIDERTDLEGSQKVSSWCNIPPRYIAFDDGRQTSPIVSQKIS
jgi:hypothetical protein